MKLIKKQIIKTKFTNDDFYLLGQDEDNKKLYLREASWHCGWYWGFGYIQSINKPRTDINLHTHYNSIMWKEINGKYIYHFNELPNLKSSVLTDSESWQLSDLMKSFYTLREAAEVFHRGNSNFTTNIAISLKDSKTCKLINEVYIPLIFANVYTILTP